MRSDAVACPSSSMRHSCAAGPYGVRGPDPDRQSVMPDSSADFAGLPNPVSLTFRPCAVLRHSRAIRGHPLNMPSRQCRRVPNSVSTPLMCASGSFRRRPARVLVDRQRRMMRAILFARAAAASFSGCSASILLSQGSSEFRAPARMTEHGRCARDKQLTEAALPHPCDPAEPLPSRGRAPPQGQPGLGREVTPAFEALHRRREGVNRHRADRPDAGDCHQPPEFLAFPRPGATQRHGTSHSRQQLLPLAGPGQRMAELPSRLDVLLPPGIVVLDARR